MTFTNKTNFCERVRLYLNESSGKRAQKMKKPIDWNIYLLVRLLLVKCVAVDDLHLRCIYSIENKQFWAIDVEIGQVYENGKESGIYIRMKGLIW